MIKTLRYMMLGAVLVMAGTSCSDNDEYDYNRQIKKFPTEKQNVSLKHILT